ncbi:MAG TPA: DMT family transporter [Beijerinckiaceae bacterium]|jgi:drug/metabolite transporter (DMT)-like permease
MTDGASIAPPGRLQAGDLGLYAVTVTVWGTSWIAMKGQLGTVAPEVSTFWRFLLAAPLMWLWAAAMGERLAWPLADHLRFAASGAFLFSSNLALFLYAAKYLPSGLLAVVFSLVSILNLLMGAVFLGQPVERRVAAGGLLGAAGVGLLYWPEFARAGFERGALIGLGLALSGTLSFCLGNLAAALTQRRGVPMLAATAWGMTYGVAVLAAIALLRGEPFAAEWTPRYLGSTLYLALFASVVAFASYLTLLRRIGAARAGYATVLFPVVALTVSTLVEGYRWTLPAALGAALALLGNVLVLRR